MVTRVAINGFGRIGRNITRALYEAGLRGEIQLVAINDLADLETNVHLLKYDSVHGRFPGEVRQEAGDLVINNDQVKVFAERQPSHLPWKELGIDVVMECTGLFASREKAEVHLQAGAKKVLISTL